MNASDLTALVRDIHDFPEPGILFKDITPVLAHPDAFAALVDQMAAPFLDQRVDAVAGIEARGFILATPVARALGTGFVPLRKPGKLPYDVVREEYALEYGTDALEMHRDAVSPGERVLIVDDVIATGGTAAAAVSLLESAGAETLGVSVFIELGFLNGKSLLGATPLHAITTYD
jgi:adenine phosphoribosyltransferase